MQLTKHRKSRLGMSALEVVLATAVILPMAAAGYILMEEAMQNYFFLIDNAVGFPFL
jgi:hypothetical protein